MSKKSISTSCGVFLELPIGYDQKNIQDWNIEALKNNQNVIKAYMSKKIYSLITGNEYIIYNAERIK